MTRNTKKLVDFSTGEERRTNTGFTQVYDEWWSLQRQIIREYPMALSVFSWLVEVSDKRNAVVVSYSAISEALGYHKRTIMRAVAFLVKKKIITILKSGNTNVYYLNDRIIWKDTADIKNKYSKFSAEVYIVASEQERDFRSQLIGHAVQKPVGESKKIRTSTKSDFA